MSFYRLRRKAWKKNSGTTPLRKRSRISRQERSYFALTIRTVRMKVTLSAPDSSRRQTTSTSWPFTDAALSVFRSEKALPRGLIFLRWSQRIPIITRQLSQYRSTTTLQRPAYQLRSAALQQGCAQTLQASRQSSGAQGICSLFWPEEAASLREAATPKLLSTL